MYIVKEQLFCITETLSVVTRLEYFIIFRLEKKTMQYDYSKLNNPKVLDVIEVHFKTREMTILEGSEAIIIYIENGPTFIIDNDEVLYYSGIKRMTPENMNKLVAVANKLQSTLTLECPVLDQKAHKDMFYNTIQELDALLTQHFQNKEPYSLKHELVTDEVMQITIKNGDKIV